jgi:glycosyltransferase involved in cell wall biosynthesis
MGAYPTTRVRRTAHVLRIADKGRVARLMERDEGIPASNLQPQLAAELLFELVQVGGRIPILRWLHPRLHTMVLRLYGRLAARELRRLGPKAGVFHFLAAYGHTSIGEAKRLGMVTLCDHAIVHPLVIDELVENRGRLRHGQDTARPRLPTDTHWQAKVADLAQTDAVIVNSDFVRDTFISVGWPAERVHVAYLGVDEGFVRGLGPVTREVPRGPLELLYAGRVEPRKGVDVLFGALAELDDVDWRLTLAGPIEQAVERAHRVFLEDRRVRQVGTVLRTRLRDLMLGTPVFVFPSYAEGSARVVFEAMACGCYIITTPNAGSIVEDGAHGALITPGSRDELIAAVRAADRDRARLAAIGTRNAALVRERYRQKHYGDRLSEIYDALPRSPAARA